MPKTILVATEKPFAKAAVDRMKEVVAKNSGFELKLLEKYTDKQDLVDAVKEADGLIIRSDKVTREVLDAAKNLKVVARGGAGYDNVDLEAATEKGICVARLGKGFGMDVYAHDPYVDKSIMEADGVTPVDSSLFHLRFCQPSHSGECRNRQLH